MILNNLSRNGKLKIAVDLGNTLKTREDNSSVIRQKGESQNEGNKKTKHAKCSEK